MGIRDLDRFNQFANDVGNRFLAINMICQWSRQLEKEYSNYRIPANKLIDWVIYSRCPYSPEELSRRQIFTFDDKLDKVLEWIDDAEVKDEVKSLYKYSIKHRHLSLCNNLTINKYKQGRINTILRMLWFSIDTETELILNDVGGNNLNSYLSSLVLKDEVTETENYVSQGSKPHQIPYEKPEILDGPPISGKDEDTIEAEPMEVTNEEAEIEVEQPKIEDNEPKIDVRTGSKPHQTEETTNITEDSVKEEPKVGVTTYTKGQIIPVINVKVYRLPNERSYFQVFSGNLVYHSKSVADFTRVEYMMSGFGLVSGYVKNLK